MSETRIYQLPLARKFSSKAVVVALQDLGIPAKSPSSHVELPPLFVEELDHILHQRKQSREAYDALNGLLLKKGAEFLARKEKVEVVSDTHKEHMGPDYKVTIQHCESCNKFLGVNYPSDFCTECQSRIDRRAKQIVDGTVADVPENWDEEQPGDTHP